MTWMTILKKLAIEAIPTIIEFGKKMLEKIGSIPSMNENSSVTDIEQISNALYELREHVLHQSQSTIQNTNDSFKFYVEEQLFNIEDKSKLLAKYEISSRSVERKIQNIQEYLNKYWQDSINRRISLDNAKCRSILMLPAGAKKAADIEKFTDEVLTETLNEYADIIREDLNSLYVDLEDDIVRSVLRLENTVNDYTKMVESLDAKDNDKFEQLIAKAQTKIFCYDVMLKKVRA